MRLATDPTGRGLGEGAGRATVFVPEFDARPAAACVDPNEAPVVGVRGARRAGVAHDGRIASIEEVSEEAGTGTARTGRRTTAIRAGRERRHRIGSALERAVPAGGVDVDVAHRDAMVARVAEDLRGRVEAHRLAVEERRREGGGMVALQPGARVDEEREARRVRFGKAVPRESLDLLEDLVREGLAVPARGHPGDERFAEGGDPVAVALPRRDRAAQFVGLPGREAGGDHRERHRLLLEERDAEGLAEHLANGLVGIADGLLAVPAAQVGMDHVALDRAGTDDRDLDDEVVEGARSQAREHRHLRARFDLEDADGVGEADHVVGRGILGWDAVQAERRGHGTTFGRARRIRASDRRVRPRGDAGPAAIGTDRKQIAARRRRIGRASRRRARRERHPVGVDECDRLADRRQHAERQQVDLEHAERLDVVLVPLDDRTVVHRGPLDGHALAERSARDHEPADMLRAVAREAEDLAHEADEMRGARRCGIESGLAKPRGGFTPKAGGRPSGMRGGVVARERG